MARPTHKFDHSTGLCAILRYTVSTTVACFAKLSSQSCLCRDSFSDWFSVPQRRISPTSRRGSQVDQSRTVAAVTRAANSKSPTSAPARAPKSKNRSTPSATSLFNSHLFPLGSWRFMWRARWSDRAKDLSQTLHLKGLAPVCFRMWRVSSSERANLHKQFWKWQRYGFSPESRNGTKRKL